MNLYVATIECFMNLCDPLIDLNKRVSNAISAVKKLNSKITDEDVFISGHSLGAVGAANYYYINLERKFAGLAIYGS